MAAKLLVVLSLVASVVLAAGNIKQREEKYLHPAIRDYSRRLASIGFADEKWPKTESGVHGFLKEQFPLLLSGKIRTRDDAKKLGPLESKKLYAEAVRWTVLIKTLRQRHTNQDKAILLIIKSGDWECSVCTWVVGELKDKLSDYGCDAASDLFGQVCAAIPYVGEWTVPECVAILKWGCGKLLHYIENGVTSNSALCNDVFGVCG